MRAPWTKLSSYPIYTPLPEERASQEVSDSQCLASCRISSFPGGIMWSGRWPAQLCNHRQAPAVKTHRCFVPVRKCAPSREHATLICRHSSAHNPPLSFLLLVSMPLKLYCTLPSYLSSRGTARPLPLRATKRACRASSCMLQQAALRLRISTRETRATDPHHTPPRISNAPPCM